MSEASAPAEKGNSLFGLVLGLVSFATGGLSILILALFFAPLGILSGAGGTLLSLRKRYTVGAALGIVGIIFSGIGLATSPMFWLAMAGTGMAVSSLSQPAPVPMKPLMPVSLPKLQPVATVEPPKTVDGDARVIDSATLMVSGVKVALNGAVATTHDQATTLQDFIRLQGGTVHCDPQGDAAYVCRTKQGVDVAEAAILNGAARAAVSAPATYQQRQAQAIQRKAGIWAN